MKILLLLVCCFGVNGKFISTGLTTTAGSSRAKKIIGDIDDSGENEEKVAELGNRYGILLKRNEEDVTNEDNFERPCSLEDYECIRQYFEDNSNCEAAYGPVSDPLYLKQNTIFFQFTNMSLTFTDLQVKGLSQSKIIEFYYNRVTNNLVFAFEVPMLNETTPKGYYTYYRTAKESIVKTGFGTVTYYNNKFTVVIPKIPKLRLDLAEVHVYIPNSAPSFYISPDAYESKDPDVIEGIASLLESVSILYRETFIFQAQLFAAVYIQENICDFDLKLYSL